MDMTRMLEGKKCVITSGAHGLGYDIARLFSLHGAAVAICGRNETGIESEKELKKYNKDSFFVKCDMSKMDEVQSFADEVLRRFGTVDVLINNVGVNGKSLLRDMDMETYDMVQNTNLKSSVLLTKIIVANMIDNGIEGSIVNISSMNALAPSPTVGAYCASKGGMNAFTRALAVETGKYGIRANVICPGWIATTYIMKDIEDAAKEGKTPFDVLEYYNGTSPLLAPARAKDIANHALFFASDMSSYITGALIRSDGAAVLQAHACDYPEPEDAVDMRRAYYETF